MSKSDIQAWLDRMEIGEWGNKKIDALSKGMAQKVQFIAAILGDPELIILDEPFTGLDPVNANLFRNMILDRRRTGATIILSTHDMSVAEKMCDRIFMIFKGRKVLDGSLEKVQQEYGDDTIRVRLESNGQSLDRVDGVSEVNDFGQYQELRLADGADSQEVLSRLMGMGRVRHFELARPSLHDIFVRIAGPEGARAQADTMQDGGWLEMEAPARA
jgi:ABC-2 type transport system ATP-binding protein